MRISDWSSDVCSSDLPRPVEIEAARANIARLDFVEDFHAVDDRAVLALASEAADIARPARRLSRGELIDDIVGAAAHFGIAGLLPGQHQRGHLMAQRIERKSVV